MSVGWGIPAVGAQASAPAVPATRCAARLLAVAVCVAMALLTLPAAATPDGQWVRIAFDAPITAADRGAVAEAGAQAVHYLPVDSYVAWADGPTDERLSELDGAQVAPLEAAAKVDPVLSDASGPTRVQVLSWEPAGTGALGRIGTVVNPHPTGHEMGLSSQSVLLASHTRIPRLAALPEVLSVSAASDGLRAEDEGTAQILAGNLEVGAPVPGYEDFLAERGLDGSGVAISVVDTGVDDSHPDLDGKVVARYSYSHLTTSEPIDASGHGTHVAGIVAGAGAQGILGDRPVDGANLALGLGVAPGASLVDQAGIATTAVSWPPPGGWEVLSRDAVQAGAVAWNASWTSGEGAGAGYLASARAMDVIARDADPTSAGHQPLTLVFSAGNSGWDPQTITAPKEAKNIIVVGSSRSHRASGGLETVSTFSSRGPAVDGRILPTLVAPGEAVASSRVLIAGRSGCALPYTDGLGDHPEAWRYAVCSGTSMAAPHVAGSVALLHQWWGQRHDGDAPSPALAKALLVNTARPLATSDVPNNEQGWGRVSLRSLFDEEVERIIIDQAELLTERGQTFELRVEPVEADRPLKVTLAWTDPPGLPGANPALVNDLDLTVTGPQDVTYLGNVFDRGWSRPGGTRDRRNNLENVFIAEPDGRYQVAVSAANLPGNAIPGGPNNTAQDFALVISNAREVAPEQES